LSRNQYRSPLYALLNLGFIAVLAGWQAGLMVLAALVIVWLLARVARGDLYANLWVGLAMALTLGLFLLHKLPGWSADLHVAQINPLLKVIAYSYICLRLIELFRAMYEKRYDAPDLISVINYLVPFQMLAAGPIQSYDEFIEQPGMPRPLTADTALAASWRIAWGIFKKFVLAFFVQKTFLTNFTSAGPYWFIYWLFEAQMFFIWLFLDFSAYSDIAVGIGQLIGVATPENFNQPYFARNMIIFWERWHISLSMWIRRNLFFPIQINLIRWTGGKNPTTCAAVGFIISFLLCGMWHGIALNFVVWGVMHSSGLIIVNLYRQYLTKRLGSKGVKAYLANPYIRVAAIALTFEWVALSHLTFFYRF
jgi:D-alanyl-lipoteichoic acid acyltransferase DltB (MBOAT superfamily)